jgi:hypothetical protein
MKTKGAVKNGHSRDTGDIGHTRQRQTNKKYKAQQITENYKDEQHVPHQNRVVTQVLMKSTQFKMCWTPLYANNKKKYIIRHKPSYKQLGVKLC